MNNGPELIVISEKEKGKPFSLSCKAHVLGRSKASDICIQDSTVSSVHCEFVRTDSGSYIIRDMDSTNGTKVNDKYVKCVELKNGDILRIGKTELLYSAEGHSAALGPDAKTIIDLANVGDSEPIAPMANVSGVFENISLKEKVFSKITVYLSIALTIIIILLILWLLLVIK